MRTLIIATLMLLATPAVAQVCPPVGVAELGLSPVVRPFGMFPSSDGDRMAVVVGNGDPFSVPNFFRSLEVYDIATPSTPVLVTSVSLEGVVNVEGTSVPVLDGDFVWLYTNSDVFRVDIADPANVPPPTSVYSGEIDSLRRGGSIFYIQNNQRIRLLDVSDPMAPVEGIEFKHAGGDFNAGFIIEGDRLYAIDTEVTDSVLFTWDVSDAQNPVLIAQAVLAGTNAFFPRAGPQSDVVVDGILYVQTPSGVALFDVSDPAAPTQRSVITNARRGVLHGDLYYSNSFNFDTSTWEFMIHDVSDLDAPTRVFTTQFADEPTFQRFVTGISDSLVFAVDTFQADFGFVSAPALLIDVSCSTTGLPDGCVYIYEDTVVGANEDAIRGNPIDGATIKVGGPGTEYSPGFIISPTASVSLTLEGDRRLGGLEVLAGGTCTLIGDVEVPSVRVDAASLVSRGSLASDDVTVSDGASLDLDGTLESLRVHIADASVRLIGSAASAEFRADASTVTVNGELTTGSLELLNGSVITQEQP